MLKLAIDAKLAWPAVRPFFLAPLPARVTTTPCLLVFFRPRIVAAVHTRTQMVKTAIKHSIESACRMLPSHLPTLSSTCVLVVVPPSDPVLIMSGAFIC